MGVLSYILLFLFALPLQLKVVPLFAIKGIIPNIVSVLVISLTLQHGRFHGILAGFVVGLSMDLLGTGLVGASSFANTLLAFMVGFLGRQQLERKFGNLIGLMFVALLVHDSVYFLIQGIGSSLGFWRILLTQALPQSCYTLVFILIFHLLYPKLFQTTTQY